MATSGYSTPWRIHLGGIISARGEFITGTIARAGRHENDGARPIGIEPGAAIVHAGTELQLPAVVWL
jgi:hypothetical protein